MACFFVWSEQDCHLQKLYTFEGWTLIHYHFSVGSMLWIWNLYLSKMDRSQNAPSTKYFGLYPIMCNDKSHLHSVLSVNSTPPKSVENEGWKLQNLVWSKFLPPTPALHMSHLQDAKWAIIFMTIHCNTKRWWGMVTLMHTCVLRTYLSGGYLPCRKYYKVWYVSKLGYMLVIKCTLSVNIIFWGNLF